LSTQNHTNFPNIDTSN